MQKRLMLNEQIFIPEYYQFGMPDTFQPDLQCPFGTNYIILAKRVPEACCYIAAKENRQ